MVNTRTLSILNLAPETTANPDPVQPEWIAPLGPATNPLVQVGRLGEPPRVVGREGGGRVGSGGNPPQPLTRTPIGQNPPNTIQTLESKINPSRKVTTTAQGQHINWKRNSMIVLQMDSIHSSKFWKSSQNHTSGLPMRASSGCHKQMDKTHRIYLNNLESFSLPVSKNMNKPTSTTQL